MGVKTFTRRSEPRAVSKIRKEIAMALAEHEEGLAEDARELADLTGWDDWGDEVVSKPKPPSRFRFAAYRAKVEAAAAKLARARRVALEMKRGEEAALATDDFELW